MSYDDYDSVFERSRLRLGMHHSEWNDEFNASTKLAKDWIAPIFKHDSPLKQLPTAQDYLEFARSRDMQLLHVFRTEHIRYSYIPLTDELMRSIRGMTQDLKTVRLVELAAGAGWLTHWLNKYGVYADAVDNHSWAFKFCEKLPLVARTDAVQYVKRHAETDLYILSWPPYKKPLAANIWKAMKSGQYLLYIGEGEGGCTADDKFFELTREHQVEDKWNLQNDYFQFWGMHDWPTLYCKP